MAVRIGQGRGLGPVFFREWREHRHMTQETLAEHIGAANKSGVSKIENNEYPGGYSQASVEVIADALHCKPWELIAGPPDTALERAPPNSIDENLLLDLMAIALQDAGESEAETLSRIILDRAKGGGPGIDEVTVRVEFRGQLAEARTPHRRRPPRKRSNPPPSPPRRSP